MAPAKRAPAKSRAVRLHFKFEIFGRVYQGDYTHAEFMDNATRYLSHKLSFLPKELIQSRAKTMWNEKLKEVQAQRARSEPLIAKRMRGDKQQQQQKKSPQPKPSAKPTYRPLQFDEVSNDNGPDSDVSNGPMEVRPKPKPSTKRSRSPSDPTLVLQFPPPGTKQTISTPMKHNVDVLSPIFAKEEEFTYKELYSQPIRTSSFSDAHDSFNDYLPITMVDDEMDGNNNNHAGRPRLTTTIDPVDPSARSSITETSDAFVKELSPPPCPPSKPMSFKDLISEKPIHLDFLRDESNESTPSSIPETDEEESMDTSPPSNQGDADDEEDTEEEDEDAEIMNHSSSSIDGDVDNEDGGSLDEADDEEDGDLPRDDFDDEDVEI